MSAWDAAEAAIDIWPFIESIEDYAVFLLDPQGHVLTWNRGARRINGWERAEIVGRSFETFYPEEDLRAGKPAWELCEAARVGRFEDEGWRLRKDGTRFWANVVITAGRDEQGELKGFVKVTRDLTARREAEARLREEQAGRAAAEALAQRLAVLRSIAQASLATATLERSAVLDALVRSVQAYVPADGASVLLLSAERGELVVAASCGLEWAADVGRRVPVGRGVTGRVAATRAPIVVADLRDTEVLFTSRAAELRSAAGVPLLAGDALLGVLLVATRVPRSFSEEDVTLLRLVADIIASAVQRAEAHAALVESERRFRAIFDLAPVGVAQVGLDGRWLRVNAAFSAMVGYSADELYATTFQRLTHPDDLPEDLDCYARLIAGEIDRYTVEKRYFHCDGRTVWIQLTVALVRDDDGRPLYAISVIEDVGERRRAREERERLLGELREALATRDRFLSMASHELRTPLTALTLQTHTLIGAQAGGAERELPPRVVARLASMQRQLDRLSALVEQLLDVSRIHEGRLSLHVEEVDLGALAREVAERFDEQAAKERTPIGVVVEGTVTGRWDRLRLDQVLTNLVSNAVKYGGHQPISIAVEVEGDRAKVSVIDRGIGIRPEDRGRLFLRFERLASDPHIQGIGLGLWITREIVEALGGSIRVESAPGRGTTFTVELPRGGPPSAAVAPLAA